MIYIHWLFLALYTILATIAIITVLLEHRQPAKNDGMDTGALLFAYSGHSLVLLLWAKNATFGNGESTS